MWNAKFQSFYKKKIAEYLSGLAWIDFWVAIGEDILDQIQNKKAQTMKEKMGKFCHIKEFLFIKR